MNEVVVVKAEPYNSASGSRRLPLKWLALTVAVLVAGVGIGWATATVLTPAEDPLDATAFTTAEAIEGQVGSSFSLNTVAQWSPVPVGSNQSTGVITSVNVEPGQSVSAGTVLFTVNLRPIVIAQGAIPSFQSLSSGMSGADVAQVQSLLAALGFYTYDVDGNFDYVTRLAVQAWQTSLGISADGVIRPGDIVFVPSLPARVALDTEKVKRGGTLAGGEEVVESLPTSPTFTIPVSSSQASLMPTGTRVEITGPNGEQWEGYALEQITDDKGEIAVLLQGVEQTSICADHCESIPVTGQALLSSRIVTVESITGLTVPTAALLSDAGGIVSVVAEDGAEHPVTIIASAQGVSVIEGITAGQIVRVPAKRD